MSTDDVPSPCVNLCKMSEALGLCQGCYRTIEEIAAWAGLSRDAKRAVLQDLSRRKRLLRDQSQGRQDQRLT